MFKRKKKSEQAKPAEQVLAANKKTTEKPKKRTSIRRKVLLLVLIPLFLAIFITALVGLRSFFAIFDESVGVLSQMEENLLAVAKSKSKFAEVELQQYVKYAESFAIYIEEVFRNPEKYTRSELLPASTVDGEGTNIRRIYASPDIDEAAVREEGELLARAEEVFYPIVCTNATTITSCYIATESGQMIFYDDQNTYEDIYNYFDALWYKGAKTAGRTIYSDAYLDHFGQGLMITCAAPFLDADGEFAGVVAIDIVISDLYESAMSLRVDDEVGATAFLLAADGSEITPQLPKDASVQDITNAFIPPEVTVSRILEEDEGVFTYNGDYYAFSRIESTDWEYCLRVPMRTILSSWLKVEFSIFVSFGMLLLALLALIPLEIFGVTKAVKQFTKPILALGADAAEISNGNFDHRATVYANDEIGDLAVDFNNMAISLKQYIADLASVTSEKERIGAELNIARQIQADMLPSIFPPFPDRKEFDIFATMTPAREVGGDFYDFFLVDEDHIALVIADVSDKGVPAALFMTISKTLIKTRAQMGKTLSPAAILTDVSNRLYEGNEALLFVTVWLAIIDIRTGKGLAANAGHEHPVLRRAGGLYELIVYHHSPALAVKEGVIFREHEFELHPGDTIYVYTDGVPEATDAEEKLFGTGRMLEALNREPDAEPEELLAHVKQGIDEFVDNAPQFDDITMLAFAYHGPGDGSA